MISVYLLLDLCMNIAFFPTRDASPPLEVAFGILAHCYISTLATRYRIYAIVSPLSVALEASVMRTRAYCPGR